MTSQVTDHRRATAERNVTAILDAAAELLSQPGPASIAAVAAQAGVSRVTVYAHFPTWEALLEAVVERADGGDARRFRRGITARFGDDEVAAWRHCEQVLTPLRPRIRQVARALLVHPRHLPYQVAAALAEGA